MYSLGNGVGKDLDEALKWDQRAADQGDEDAKKSITDSTSSGLPSIFIKY